MFKPNCGACRSREVKFRPDYRRAAPVSSDDPASVVSRVHLVMVLSVDVDEEEFS